MQVINKAAQSRYVKHNEIEHKIEQMEVSR